MVFLLAHLTLQHGIQVSTSAAKFADIHDHVGISLEFISITSPFYFMITVSGVVYDLSSLLRRLWHYPANSHYPLSFQTSFL